MTANAEKWKPSHTGAGALGVGGRLSTPESLSICPSHFWHPRSPAKPPLDACCPLCLGRVGWLCCCLSPWGIDPPWRRFPSRFSMAIHTSSSRASFICFIEDFGNTLLERQESDPSALAREGGSLSLLCPHPAPLLRKRENPPGRWGKGLKSKSLASTAVLQLPSGLSR